MSYQYIKPWSPTTVTVHPLCGTHDLSTSLTIFEVLRSITVVTGTKSCSSRQQGRFEAGTVWRATAKESDASGNGCKFASFLVVLVVCFLFFWSCLVLLVFRSSETVDQRKTACPRYSVILSCTSDTSPVGVWSPLVLLTWRDQG
jgi:hypothetical protein